MADQAADDWGPPVGAAGPDDWGTPVHAAASPPKPQPTPAKDPGYLAQTVPALTEAVTGGIPFLEGLGNPVLGAEQTYNTVAPIFGGKQIPDKYMAGSTEHELNDWLPASANPENTPAVTPGERAYRSALTMGASALVPVGGLEGGVAHVLADLAKNVPVMAASGAAGSGASEFVPDAWKPLVSNLTMLATGAGLGHAVGSIPGHEAKTPAEATLDDLATGTKPVAPPAAAPQPNETIGLKFPKGPSQRATVDHYFDNGKSVRLKFDNGRVGDFLTSDVLRDRTAAPEPMQGAPPPTTRGPAVGPDERPVPPPIDLNDWSNPVRAPRAPQTPTLNADALRALDRVHGMERTALDPNLKLSATARQDMLAEAARLRREFGATSESDVPPNAYRHPLADEPAAGLGELAAARVRNPGLYQGEYERVPFPTSAQSELPQQTAPEVDPDHASALDDINYFRARPTPDRSLFDVIRAAGGLNPIGPEGRDILNALDRYKNPRFTKKLINPNGITPARLLERLQENDWFGAWDHTQGSDAEPVGMHDDLVEQIGREAGGDKAYHDASTTPGDIDARRMLDREQTEAGVASSDRPDVAARKLADFRKTARAAELAHEEELNIDHDLSDLPPDDAERLAEHGYEPGSDIGEEHEETGEPESGGERPSDLANIEDETAQRGEPAANLGEPGADERQGELGAAELGAETPTERAAREGRVRIAEAQQLPRAHGRRAQRAADEGLFALPPEKALFEQPEGWNRVPGGLEGTSEAGRVPPRSIAGEMDRYLAASRVDKTVPRDLVMGVARFLVDRGGYAGTESLAMHNGESGEFDHVLTAHSPSSVQFTPELIEALQNSDGNFAGYHNHPSGRSLSAGDIATLSYPGMKWVVALGHNGEYYAASLGDGLRRQRDRLLAEGRKPEIVGADAASELREAYRRADAAVAPLLWNEINDGNLSRVRADQIHHHIINTILDKQGLTHYISSKELAPHEQEIANYAISNATDSPYRPAQPIRFSEAVGRILRELGPPPAGARSGRGAPSRAEGAAQPRLPGLEQPDSPYRGAPANMDEVGDRLDSASDAIADELKAAPPGVYRRKLADMTPPTGENVYKDLNSVENYTIRPESMARLDTRSARVWNAEKLKESQSNAMVDELRGLIAESHLALNDTERNRVYAARELDRINGLTREDDGRSVVARNEGADFAHFSKPGEVVALTPKETAAYHALTDMFDRSWKNVMEGAARKVGWHGEWDRDDMDANIKRIQEVGENTADRGLQKISDRATKILTTLDAHRRTGYHPLMRFGDYFVHVSPREGTDTASLGGYGRSVLFSLAEPEMRDRLLGGSRKGNEVPRYAKQMVGDAIAKYPPDKYRVEHGFLANTPDMLNHVDLPAIEKLMMFVENDMLGTLRDEAVARGVPKGEARAEAARRYDDLYGAMVDKLWDRAYAELEAGYKKKANTIPGYSNDFDRALGTYMHWTSRNVADQIHREAIDSAHTDLQTDPRVNKDVKRYWNKWKLAQEEPNNVFNRAVNGMARWGFLTAMGVNPSSSAVVGAHGLFMAGPTLSVGIGMRRAGPAFFKGWSDAMSGVRVDAGGLHIDDLSKVTKDAAELKFLKALDAEGILHSRAIQDMAALNETQSDLWGSARSTARKVMDAALTNVAVMDRANRIGSALSAFRLAGNPAVLKQMDAAWRPHNQAWRDAADQKGVSRETMARFMVPNMVGEYGALNRAPIERNAFSRAMLGMHGFVTRLLSNMWKLGTSGPQGRMALMWTLGAFYTLAGADGIPFAQDIQNFADLLWKQATGKDPMITYRVQSGLASVFGKTGAEMILHGPVSTVTGVDVAHRLGLGDLISRNWPTAENTLGAYPSIIMGRVIGAAQQIESGQYAAAAAEALPGGLRNAAMAAIERENGVRSRHGKTLVTRQRITPGATAARAAGFTPMVTEHAYENADFGYRAKQAHMRPPRNPIPQD